MFQIMRKEKLSEDLTQFEIQAPDIARKAKPGNFFVLRTHGHGARIPLTISGFDRRKETITAVLLKVGKTSHYLGNFGEGDTITDVIGPLGNQSDMKYWSGRVCRRPGGDSSCISGNKI